MLKSVFRLGYFLIFLLLTTFTEAANAAPGPGDGTNCTLPAPQNLSWSATTGPGGVPTLHFNWDAVGGAWGYRMDYASPSNTATYTTQANNLDVPYTIGESATVTLRAMCDPNSTSVNALISPVFTIIVITEVITEHTMPDCQSEMVPVPRIAGVDGFMPFNGWVNNAPYYIKATAGAATVTVGIIYHASENPELSVYLVDNNPSGASIAGVTQYSGSMYFQDFMIKYVNGSQSYRCKLHAAKNGMGQRQLIIDPDNQFSTIGVFSCSGGNSHYQSGGHNQPSGLVAPVSPFTDALTLSFQDLQRNTAVTIRLLDLNGGLRLEETFPSENLAFGGLALDTQSLGAGMYVLQVQTADGQTEVHKVVKY